MMTVAATALLLALGSTNTVEWPQWRGPFNNGMAVGDAPVTWDASNIRWQLEIPGRGHSTPVIAGHRMFLTTAVPTGKGTPPQDGGPRRRRRRRGTRAPLRRPGDRSHHGKDCSGSGRQPSPRRTRATIAPTAASRRTRRSPTARACSAFFGSRGLYAYDMNGTLLWKKDFGVQMRMDLAFGEGTPLTLHDGRLLLHFDHLDTGFLVMLDPATGREIWRTKRTERFNWAAPYVAQHDGRRQIIVSGETVRELRLRDRPVAVGGRGPRREHDPAAGAARRPGVRDERPHDQDADGDPARPHGHADRHGRHRLVHGARRVVHAVTAAARRPALRRHRQRHGQLLRCRNREAALPAGSGCRSRTASRPRRSAPPASSTSRRKRATSSSCGWEISFEVLATNTLRQPVVHRVAGDRRRHDLPAQPDAPVRDPLGGQHPQVRCCDCDCRCA